MKHSLATRYGLLLAAMTAVIGCCVLLINLFYLDRYARQSVETGQTHLSNAMTRQLIRDAELVASSLASNLDTAVYNHDFSAIQEQLEAVGSESHVAYTYIYDLNRRIIHDGSAELLHYGRPVSELLPAGITATLTAETVKNDRYIHVAHPIRSGGTTFAVLRIAITYSDAESDIRSFSAELAKESEHQRNNVIFTSLTVITVMLLMATLIVFALSQHLLRPVRWLAEQCRLYASGRTGIRFAVDRSDELGLLGEALEEMRRSISTSQRQVEQLAYHDPLTHLPNRRLFNEQLELLINWADETHSSLAILFIDLDHFKQVNDVAGHEVGDKLLVQTANRLCNLIDGLNLQNHQPIPRELLLARLGGDEFVMLLPGVSLHHELEQVATQIADLLENTFTIDNRRFNVSASIGITLFPEYGHSTSELLKQADIAMYEAKHSGRKRHCFFEPEMNSAVVGKMLIQQGVRDAMMCDELYLAYQPIVDLSDGTIIGAESLIRWRHPERGNIPPDSFIPIIEQTDLIVPLTLWTLQRACEDLKRHILPHYPGFKLSVNISGATLQDQSIRTRIQEILEQSQLPPDTLHLELTETSMVENISSCADTLQDWKNSGADIWIDDFGTGYSSLNYLHSLPIDGLKIDRSFVQDMRPGSGNQVIETILALAGSMGLDTVSEGIETDLQRSTLSKHGCRYGQGYLFAHPAPLSDLLQLLEKESECESV